MCMIKHTLMFSLMALLQLLNAVPLGLFEMIQANIAPQLSADLSSKRVCKGLFIPRLCGKISLCFWETCLMWACKPI